MKKCQIALTKLIDEAEDLTRKKRVEEVGIIPGTNPEENEAIYAELRKRNIPFYLGTEIAPKSYSIDMRRISLA